MSIRRLGHLIDAPTRKWLTRVLGSPHALSRLTGPRAVTMTNGRGMLRAMLLMAIPRLLTILSSVDRAPGEVWPTLLVSMTDVNIGFLWNLNLLRPRLQKATLIMLDGSRLGANRTCPNDVSTESVTFCVSRAPLAFGPLLSRIRLLMSRVARYRWTGRVPLIMMAEMPVSSVLNVRPKQVTLLVSVGARGPAPVMVGPVAIGCVVVVMGAPVASVPGKVMPGTPVVGVAAGRRTESSRAVLRLMLAPVGLPPAAPLLALSMGEMVLLPAPPRIGDRVDPPRISPVRDGPVRVDPPFWTVPLVVVFLWCPGNAGTVMAGVFPDPLVLLIVVLFSVRGALETMALLDNIALLEILALLLSVDEVDRVIASPLVPFLVALPPLVVPLLVSPPIASGVVVPAAVLVDRVAPLDDRMAPLDNIASLDSRAVLLSLPSLSTATSSDARGGWRRCTGRRTADKLRLARG